MKQKVNIKKKIPIKGNKKINNEKILIIERSREDVKSSSYLNSQETNLNGCTSPIELSFKSSFEKNSDIGQSKNLIKKDLKNQNLKIKKKKIY